MEMESNSGDEDEFRRPAEPPNTSTPSASCSDLPGTSPGCSPVSSLIVEANASESDTMVESEETVAVDLKQMCLICGTDIEEDLKDYNSITSGADNFNNVYG